MIWFCFGLVRGFRPHRGLCGVVAKMQPSNQFIFGMRIGAVLGVAPILGYKNRPYIWLERGVSWVGGGGDTP